VLVPDISRGDCLPTVLLLEELASIADRRVTVDRRWTADTVDQCLIVAVAREGGSLFPIYVCIHRV